MEEGTDVARGERHGSNGADTEKDSQPSGPGPEQEQTERSEPSKMLSRRNAKTFIKTNSTKRKADVIQPLPWPMPPKISEHHRKTASLGSDNQSKEADKEFLTPQSSFGQGEDNATFVHHVQSTDSCRNGSGTFSRESSVKRESFSSVGTGFSLALLDSSDNCSTESVSKVDIDTDEFSRFLTEKVKSSQSGLDFGELFADENQQEKSPASNVLAHPERDSSSQVTEKSTTPKATRAPFLNSDSLESNTVSLKEALEFSPDYKTLGPHHTHPYDDETNKCEEKAAKREPLKEEEDYVKIANIQNKEQAVRRPMASRQKTFMILPPAKDDTSSTTKISQETDIAEKTKESSSIATTPFIETQRIDKTTTPVKGVIMRAQTHVSHVAGIRRAETGRIMSRAEMRAHKPILFQESPNPKSLNPAAFMSEEEEAPTVHPSAFFPKSSSDSDTTANEQATKSRTSQTNTPVSPKQKSSGRRATPSKVDDGSFLSPGILSRKKKFGAEEYKVDSFQFSEHEGSSGLLNRFSSGFRKVQFGVGKKSSSQDVTQEGDSTIFVPGTIDETVCKICVVCRKNLECNVYVKDTGKKIKVESRKDGRSRHLRATILVRQVPGESSCFVNIRQSRSDGMKTSLATLWNFYQRLEAGLKEMG